VCSRPLNPNLGIIILPHSSLMPPPSRRPPPSRDAIAPSSTLGQISTNARYVFTAMPPSSRPMGARPAIIDLSLSMPSTTPARPHHRRPQPFLTPTVVLKPTPVLLPSMRISYSAPMITLQCLTHHPLTWMVVATTLKRFTQMFKYLVYLLLLS
jgi:hypothetical protein